MTKIQLNTKYFQFNNCNEKRIGKKLLKYILSRILIYSFSYFSFINEIFLIWKVTVKIFLIWKMTVKIFLIWENNENRRFLNS